jgi:DNA segregation ATPase FtsK/SpoIIIE, S-DNA-T family
VKDSSISPLGLLDPQRARRLLRGLNQRIDQTQIRRRDTIARHSQDAAQEETQWANEKAVETDQCRRIRRQTLQQWDQAEESLIAQYESQSVQARSELNRMAVLYRRKLDEEISLVQRKVDARIEAVKHQYESRKDQPAVESKKEIERINAAMALIGEEIEWARELTMRRLSHIPEVPPPASPEEDERITPPKSVQQSLDGIHELTKRAHRVVVDMKTGTSTKVCDELVYLPTGTAIFLLLWALGVLLIAKEGWLLWVLAGIVVATFLAFSVYMIFLMPLRKKARQLHPKIERIFAAAHSCAETGRAVSARVCKDAETELLSRRDEHVTAAQRWQAEQLAEVKSRMAQEEKEKRIAQLALIQSADARFQGGLADVATKMRSLADQTAAQITGRLSTTQTQQQSRRQQSELARQDELRLLEQRLQDGISGSKDRLRRTIESVNEHLPVWSTLISNEGRPSFSRTHAGLDFLPLGWLDATSAVPLADNDVPRRLPLVLHRRLHSAVVIEAHPSQMRAAIELCHSLLWRLLVLAPPSKAKLTLIDPVGRGQHFTEFMALADHDPSIVGSRVWTAEDKIEGRLGELAHHLEDVLQSSLRDRFQRIEDYNSFAGSMAQPYRAVAAVGCPEGLSRGAYRHLTALINAGVRCGVTSVLVCSSDNTWPSDMPKPGGRGVVHLSIDAQGKWSFRDDGWESTAFEPIAPPDAATRIKLLEKIGIATVNAARVEVPLSTLLAPDQAGAGRSAHELIIPIGSQGANRSLSLRLGRGVAHHALIAGKTGSGKSTLLHAIITSGAYHYRPSELEFYLLDFKKGVEFKVYADAKLPHARVIGIESEREFGLSVLRLLDGELQRRGEAFRKQGVGELSEFREKSDQPMPRILLIMDEFQELFVRDDRLAADCAMLMDRLVRQGRSFGMHVILASQSLAGAYSLPRATLGQMAVRIAMQCGEADAALILADDNTAARLISRPGEAIYNDAGGLVEGNQPLQVAWLSNDDHHSMLSAIASRDPSDAIGSQAQIVFEGNVPCRWSAELSDAASSQASGELHGLLGEPVEIGSPLVLSLSRDAGRNVLIIAPVEARSAVLASVIIGIHRMKPSTNVIYLDATRVEDGSSASNAWSGHGVHAEIIKPRHADATLARIANEIEGRDESSTPIVLVIDPIERFKDLRPNETFSFSLDDAGSTANGGGSKSLQTILREGPAVGIYVIVVCGSVENLTRWLPRASQHDLEIKILGALNPSDSSLIMDSPLASDLSAATLLLYDEQDGKTQKFRYCAV